MRELTNTTYSSINNNIPQHTLCVNVVYLLSIVCVGLQALYKRTFPAGFGETYKYCMYLSLRNGLSF